MLAREVEGRWYRCLRCDSWLPSRAGLSQREPTRPAEILLPRAASRCATRSSSGDRDRPRVSLPLLGRWRCDLPVHLAPRRCGQLYRSSPTSRRGAAAAGRRPTACSTTSTGFSLDRTRTSSAPPSRSTPWSRGSRRSGLWFQRRWAEYLTFLVTTALLPLEIYELDATVSTLKLIAFVINLAVVAYLLWPSACSASRRRRGREREREHDVGWQALERTAPEAVA